MNIESTKYLRELRRKISEYFDLDEIATLTYDLGIDWGELSGDNKSTKTQSLITYVDRRGKLGQLLFLLREERPLIDWPDIPQILSPQNNIIDSPIETIAHNLPQPDYGYFIGRKEEINQVLRILRPYPHSQFPLVTIDGVGGVGKSSLALEIAHRFLRYHNRIPAEERFSAIIWTSAKQDILTVDGIIPRQNVRSNLENLLKTIVSVLLNDETMDVSLDVVWNLLTRRRVLLIVDNLETIDDKMVMEFLRELPAPTKAIVTTRHRLDIAFPVRLIGMSEEEAFRLIAQECRKKDVSLSEIEINELYKRTGGIPLAIVWTIANIGYGYPVDGALKRLGQPNNDVSRFCFEQVVNQIRGSKAYELLAALSLSESDATRDELGYVAAFGYDVLGRDETLVQLEKLSLIQRANDKFNILPLVRDYVLMDIKQYADLEDRLVDRWVTPNSLFLDESTYSLWVEGRQVELTMQEFNVLEYLYRHAGEPCSRSDIVENALGESYDNFDPEQSRLNSVMSRLRRKIEPDPRSPRYLFTIHGRGYRLNLSRAD